MSDARELLKVIKQAAVEAVEASSPVAVCSGTVVSVNPLKILVSSKLLLTERQLLQFRGSEITEGDKAVLLREQGGQNYIILGVI